MTATLPSHVDTSIPEVWAKRVLRTHLRSGFWGQFVGGPGSPIVQQTELKDAPGDKIHIQVTTPLVGAGVSGDTATLVGNEENLTTSEISCMPTLYRHAVRINRRANKKSIIQLREEARMRLADWGQDKMDQLRFASFISAAAINGGETYTPTLKYANDATALNNIDATDKLSVKDIRKIRALLRNAKAKPFKHNGLDVYFGVIHPYQALDLKQDTEYNTAVQQAMPRASENPIFSGALAMIDGVVLFEHFNVPTVANAGATTNLPAAKSLFFGSEFAVEAVDENVSWAEDTFDYGHEWGVAYAFATQPRRALELSSLQYLSYYTPVS